MALKKCSECGKEISTKAEKCPHCGAPVKKPTSGCAMLFVILFGVFFIGYVVSTSTSPTPATPAPASAPSVQKAKEPDDIEVWTVAQMFVKDQLKAPSTADFGSVLGDYQDPHKNVTKAADGTYVVRIWVDSQNSFGAMLREHFVLKLRYKGGQSWSLIGPPVAMPQ